MEHLVGQTLNSRYQITTLLGQGGMGAVFKARDITLQRDVAVKVMHPQFAHQPDFQQRFLQEARSAARMSHPGVVQVYDFGQAQDQLYIVMEFISGGNLGKILADLRSRSQWIVLKEAILIVRAVALALDYAHRQGVLHRDVKPENIMLKAEPGDGGLPYRPVVTDLGLAKLAGSSVVTQQGISMGTPPYMSPEQAMGNPLTAQSDVYSLGVLLFELCTGQLPFPARTITDAIQYHVKQNPPAPRMVRPDLPVALEAVILKTLEKEPARRYNDAASLARALDEALVALSAPPPPPAVVSTPVSAQPAAAAPAPPPPAAQVSLVTQFQGGALPGRGESVFESAKPVGGTPQARSDQDRIEVLGRDKSSRTFPIKPGAIHIGRGTDNEIVIDDTQSSRKHARIEFDGKYYRIVDLNSTNGTFLDDAKLLPGVPEVWTTDKVLRIGETYLRLFRAEEKLASPATRLEAPDAPKKPVETPRLLVSLDSAQYTVEPGKMIVLSILLSNQGPLVDHFKLAVEGIPAAWVPSLPPAVQLMPGAQQQVNVTLQPPRAPQSKAGVYALVVRVASRDNPGQVAEAKASLTVTPFHSFTSSLHPQKIRAGKKARVTVENESNTPGKFALSWQDRAVELDFNPLQAQVDIPEGCNSSVEFTARPRSRKLIGGEVSHPITVQVSLPAVENPQVHNGEVVSRAWIPPWIPPLLILLCLALAALLVWNLFNTQQASSLKATEVAAMTATVSAGLDTDQDGLTNARETELGTNPALADTDGDGLLDGEEVDRYATDPKDLDSDDDTLQDGQEVNVTKTSPTNRDTDGDGVPDNSDLAPQELPTVTPTPTVTPVPTQPPRLVCPDAFPSFLSLGITAKVSEDPPKSNRVRKDAGTDFDILGYISPGEQVRIMEGPKCVEGWVWWKVESLKSGLKGWTAEGDGKEYWVVPLNP